VGRDPRFEPEGRTAAVALTGGSRRSGLRRADERNERAYRELAEGTKWSACSAVAESEPAVPQKQRILARENEQLGDLLAESSPGGQRNRRQRSEHETTRSAASIPPGHGWIWIRLEETGCREARHPESVVSEIPIELMTRPRPYILDELTEKRPPDAVPTSRCCRGVRRGHTHLRMPPTIQAKRGLAARAAERAWASRSEVSCCRRPVWRESASSTFRLCINMNPSTQALVLRACRAVARGQGFPSS